MTDHPVPLSKRFSADEMADAEQDVRRIQAFMTEIERIRAVLSEPENRDVLAPVRQTMDDVGYFDTVVDLVAASSPMLVELGADEERQALYSAGVRTPDVQFSFAALLVAWTWGFARGQDDQELGGRRRTPSDLFDDIASHVRTGWAIGAAAIAVAPVPVPDFIEPVAERLNDRHDLHDAIVAAARRVFPDGIVSGGALPTMTPGFRDGQGFVPNDHITRGMRLAAQRVSDWGKDRRHPAGWEVNELAYPLFRHAGGDWGVSYQLTSDHYPTADSAWEALRQLDDDAGDIAYVALAQWLGNHARDPLGTVYLSVDQILETLGRTKHVNGGYRPEQRREAAQKFIALSKVFVQGRSMDVYERDAKGKERKTRRTLTGSFLVFSSHDEQTSFDGAPIVRGFFFRAGDWARPLLTAPEKPPLARMMQEVLRMRSVQDRIPKRIGKCMTEEFRIRAHQRSWDQPIRVDRLLENAGIEPTHSQPGRFIAFVEKGLGDLKERGIVGDWEYKEADPLPKRKMLETWLARHVVITPPDDLLAIYDQIGERGPKAAIKARSSAG